MVIQNYVGLNVVMIIVLIKRDGDDVENNVDCSYRGWSGGGTPLDQKGQLGGQSFTHRGCQVRSKAPWTEAGE